ncbi:MAG: ribonuclease HII [Hellea sp.]|nr:ribonuclease HII [Hellea sp.]
MVNSKKKFPDFLFESAYKEVVCGVDEAGRGPLAGPVVAAAVVLNPSDYPLGLNDSKVLNANKRESLFLDIARTSSIGIGIAEPEEIDRLNILHASLSAMKRAVLALNVLPDVALIDGNKAPFLPMKTECIIKGDSLSLSIAAASIIAKVTRDKLMLEAENRFPGYKFETHKGYPTKLHLQKLSLLGSSPIHRKSFKPVRLNPLQ